jgi:hypothetical protein
VVGSDGRPRDAATRAAQLGRLRREGARPRRRETNARWAKRAGVRYVGFYANREFAASDDARVQEWNGEQVEGFASEASALARGFFPIGSEGRSVVLLPERRDVPGDAGEAELAERCEQIEWASVRDELTEAGVCRFEALLTPAECARILNASTEIERFERSIDMLPRGYGVGSYHYYREPLPRPAGKLRQLFYRQLAPPGYPTTLSEFWKQCRRAGQRRASSILIGYGKGGVNHPHRDVYGPVAFPFQALLVLSQRGRDFTGGNFYVADESPDRRRTEIAVDEGDVVVFATRNREANGHKIPLRHGMTTVTGGTRWGLGMVFHLAE